MKNEYLWIFISLISWSECYLKKWPYWKSVNPYSYEFPPFQIIFAQFQLEAISSGLLRRTILPPYSRTVSLRGVHLTIKLFYLYYNWRCKSIWSRWQCLVLRLQLSFKLHHYFSQWQCSIAQTTCRVSIESVQQTIFKYFEIKRLLISTNNVRAKICLLYTSDAADE